MWHVARDTTRDIRLCSFLDHGTKDTLERSLTFEFDNAGRVRRYQFHDSKTYYGY